ncbi:MAG: adenosylcobinamide-GDP ribazoletransferase [Methanomicrobiales archaeon]|nr:adenosylcobinamide-GDP ribazoletransferase [Methanomicrobiales archaeon]NYT21561.1 adenosylcobinamide-GDP ribazoletransferase [Methanomicrobiales archaeon]
MNPLRALLQFTTVLPLGKPAEFASFARYSWLYPVAGYVTGGVAAIGVFWIGTPLLASAAAVAILFLITGAHHFDGLLDLGDGLMVHGDREKRQQALTDRQIGAGGVAVGGAVTLVSFAAMASSPVLWAALIAAEVAAKFSMAFLTAYGPPFRDGIHSFLHQASRPYFPALSALLCVPLLLLPLSLLRLGGVALVMVAVPACLLLVSRRMFGGINGDIVGASGEITRALVLSVLVIIPGSAVF